MKKSILFLIALFSVTLLYAQNNENNKYFLPPNDNENIFNQATLVFEGNFMRCVATYDTKGKGKLDDTYGIYEYRVGKVYKGDPSLAESTILIVRQRAALGDENILWNEIHHSQIAFPHPMAKGSVDIFSPAIYFLVNSDYPDDENSKYFKEKKYAFLDKVYVEGYYVAAFKDLPFSNRVELHHWMKQFDDYAFPDWEPKEWKPGPNWVNGAEQGASVFESECYKNLQIQMDSINNGTTTEIEKEIKKKEQENADKSLVDKTLTLYINNPVKVQEGSKYYLKFDVMVKSNAPETYLAETALSMKYNTSIFGSLSPNKISFTIDDHFKLGSNYLAFILLSESDGFSINFGDDPFSPNPTAAKTQLPAAPLPLLHIKMELLGNVTIPASPVFFSVSELSNVSKYTLGSNASTSYYYFKTYYKTNNPPTITNISPTSRFAGIGEILTINGSNFGTTPGKVYFRTADNGGETYLNGLDSQFIASSGCSWSNTQIKVIVPSYVVDGYENMTGSKKNGGAGTGDVMVMTAQENFVNSTQTLQIPYSIINKEYNGNIKRVYLARQTCEADFLFVLHFSLRGHLYLTSMITDMEAAMNKWSSLTGLTLKFDKNASGQPRFSDELVGLEFLERYFIGHSLSTDAMSVIPNPQQATIGGNNFLYGSTTTIMINTDAPWDYITIAGYTTGVSFYQAFLHELGHILQLGHVIDNSELMYYKLSAGHTIINLTSSHQAVIAALQNKTASNSIVTVPNNYNIYPVGTSSPLGAPKATFSVKHVSTIGGNDGHILTTPTGGVTPYSFLWTGNGLNAMTKDIYNLTTGTYSLHLSDNAGCSNNYSVVVTRLVSPATLNARSAEPNKSGIATEGNEKQDEIDVSKSNYLSINETNKEIRLIPNPNSGIFTVSNIDNAIIYLYNALGAHIKTFEHISNKETININHLSSGIYFLKIVDGGTIKNEKLILTK